MYRHTDACITTEHVKSIAFLAMSAAASLYAMIACRSSSSACWLLECWLRTCKRHQRCANVTQAESL